MGIKGVYGEIGSGTPTALVKLAVDTREKQNKSFRIAIDISIWLYQVQLGQGGTNADLRNIFYRLLRLLRLGIEPLIVFDGPHKPAFKRGKRTNTIGGSGLSASVKQLCGVFGFPYITAPGEAEAECALLQKEGVVDAVLSEDVDTLMFGCTMHLRNWDIKGKASHVDVYKASEIKAGNSGLDHEGMVLIALMSGGDYTPAGIPNCGIKTACEAARAGFGHDLVNIDRKDDIALQAWRDRLQHELHTNESKYFRIKHKTLVVPDKFPDKAVLYYYTNPVVSTSQQVQKYRNDLRWQAPNPATFWEATKEFFDWRGAEGLRHFIRNFAPALIGWRLANGHDQARSYDDIDVQTTVEEQMVKTISGRRVHDSADGIAELRIAYIPQDIVDMDIQNIPAAELEDTQAHTALYSGDEGADASDDNAGAAKVRKKTSAFYNPAVIEKDWYPEAFVKLGVPISVEKWEAEMADPKKFATRKARARKKEQEAMPKGAIEKYLHASKPGLGEAKVSVLAKTSDVSQRTNVASSFPPQASQTLTKPGLTTSIAATTKTRKAVPRSQLPPHKTVEKISTMTKHARITKVGLTSSHELVVDDQKLSVSGELSKPDGIPTKHKRTLSPVRASTGIEISLLESPTAACKTTTYSSRSRKRPAVDEVIASSIEPIFQTKPAASIMRRQPDLSESVCTSVEKDDLVHTNTVVIKIAKKRSPLSRVISAPTQTRRPAYNPWKSIDDYDTSFETPVRSSNNAAVLIDLTLT